MIPETPSQLPSWVLSPFIRPEGVNPVIRPNQHSIFDCPMRKQKVNWEYLHTFNPAAIVKDDKICVIYRAEDNTGKMQIGNHTSRLGLATSDDGVHFERNPTPILFPTEDSQKWWEWTGGCEDPRIVEAEDGRYIMTYTQYNHKIFRLGIASSRDLIHWEKHGSPFTKSGFGWTKRPIKSASILCSLQNGRLKAVKIKGKYWMYFGEWRVMLASSEDLINWHYETTIFKPQKGKFDSQLTEIGPSPLLTSDGIIVFFNGKNSSKNGDPRIPPNAYCGGQALCDPNHPQKLLDRIEYPYFKPELDFERTGQYAAGTTFTEGLVYFHERWFLYYGCADSFVAVAVCDKKI